MRCLPALLGFLLAAAAARGQTLEQLRGQIRDTARSNRYSALLAGFLDITDTQEMSAGRLYIDETPTLEVDTLKLPYARDLAFGETGPELHFEASFGAFQAKAEMDDLWQGGLPGLETGLQSRWTGVSGMLGAGPRFDLGAGLHLTPLLDVSLAYLENTALYSGPGAAVTAAALDGILFQWHATDLACGAALRLEHDVALGEQLRLGSLARCDARRYDGIDSTDAAQRDADDIYRFVLRSELSGPTGITIAERELDWSAHAGYSRFFGSEGDALGFRDCYELGCGLSFPLPSDRVLFSRVSLSGSVMFGEDLFGWNFGASVGF